MANIGQEPTLCLTRLLQFKIHILQRLQMLLHGSMALIGLGMILKSSQQLDLLRKFHQVVVGLLGKGLGFSLCFILTTQHNRGNLLSRRMASEQA